LTAINLHQLGAEINAQMIFKSGKKLFATIHMTINFQRQYQYH